MKNNIVLSLMCIIIFNLYLFNVCFDETNGLFILFLFIFSYFVKLRTVLRPGEISEKLQKCSRICTIVC